MSSRAHWGAGTNPMLETALALAMLLGACGRPLPCDDCEEEEAEAELDSDTPPDLPCGGADLQTDAENCGECGNTCPVKLEGTPWEAGGCQDGVCMPTWSSCFNGAETCADYCGYSDLECVEGGCAGVSGIRYTFGFGDFAECKPETDAKSAIESCNTLINYEASEPSQLVEAACCCALPG